jgi:hypothetical protein
MEIGFPKHSIMCNMVHRDVFERHNRSIFESTSKRCSKYPLRSLYCNHSPMLYGEFHSFQRKTG